MDTTWTPAYATSFLPSVLACHSCGRIIAHSLARCSSCGFTPLAAPDAYRDAWSGDPDTDRAWRSR